MAKKKENKKVSKPRKKKVKKDLDVKIDGVNTDVSIVRKNGKTEIDVDGKNIDISIIESLE